MDHERMAADVQAVAMDIASEEMARGAVAVVLSGSWVRGEAHPQSDVDLYALGEGPEYRLFRREPYLISLSYRAVGAVQDSFRSPGQVGSVIAGWRDAIILADPRGAARALQEEANAWTWEVVGEERCNRYVAESIVGWTEEVHKLVVALQRGVALTAAVQRSLLAVGLAPRLAVHLRLLYGSENVLWEVVAERLGDEWRRTQRVALGLDGATFADTCRATLRLYVLAVSAVYSLFGEDDRAVVDAACRLAREGAGL